MLDLSNLEVTVLTLTSSTDLKGQLADMLTT